MIEIPENVNAFVEQCGDIVAAKHRKDFCYDQIPELVVCESPIEQLFFAALRTIIDIYNYEGESELQGDNYISNGVFVFNQHNYGKYRIDFALLYLEDGVTPLNWREKPFNAKRKARKWRRLAVELDGHEFHEKNEKQRRYEKERDRYFQKEGFKVFHYTGSEIVQDPFKAAIECFAFLTSTKEQELSDLIEELRNG